MHLVTIFSGQAAGFFRVVAGFIDEIAGVKSVPIKFEIDGKKRSLKMQQNLPTCNRTIHGLLYTT